MNTILIYVVPQICRDLLNSFAKSFPNDLQYGASCNVFRVTYTSFKFHMFDDYYIITPIGLENQSIKIMKENVTSFWITNEPENKEKTIPVHEIIINGPGSKDLG